MRSIQAGFVAASSEHGVFNREFLTKFRKNDSMIATLEEVCKYIDRSLSPNIKYMGYEVVDMRKKYPENYVNVYDSNIYCVEFNFSVTGPSTKKEDKRKVITTNEKIVLEIPTLIDGDYYFINGVRFYPMYQMLDATTYHRDNYIALKTLTYPIKMIKNPALIYDTEGVEYSADIMYIDMRKKKVKDRINLFLFFFSTIGFFRTMKFFQGDANIFGFVSESNVENTDRYKYFYLCENLYLKIEPQYLSNVNIKNAIACIIDSMPKKITLTQLRTVDFWKYEIFGKIIAKTKTANKAKVDLALLNYFILYDDITKGNLAYLEGKRDTVYDVLKWMFLNYTSLEYRDNSSIFNKRIRLAEYQIAPLIRRITKKVYTIQHARNRSKTHKKFVDILTMPYKWNPNPKKEKVVNPSNILVKAIVNSNNTKYSDSVNDMDLFNISLKWTLNSSLASSKNGGISLSQRSSSPTFLGYISLNSSGAGDPGGSGIYSPFLKEYNGFFKPPTEEYKNMIGDVNEI